MPRAKSNLPKVEAAIRRKLRAGLAGASQYLQQSFQQKVGTDYPPASQMGEYPRRRTGQGQQSVEYGISRDGREARIGVLDEGGPGPLGDHEKPGGMHLYELKYEWDRPRLYLDDTFEEERPVVADVFELTARAG